MLEHIEKAFAEAAEGLQQLRQNTDTLRRIERAAEVMRSSLKGGGRLFSCGNGGSMCDAMHFAEELSGRYRKDRRALAAVAISDPGFITCAANDFGYDEVFARYIEAHGRPGDTLLAISTSGKSKSILQAAKKASALGMKVVALTGKSASALGELADIDICTPAGSYAERVQELHIKIIHIFIELIERDFFPENY